jgi:hypothetical protein
MNRLHILHRLLESIQTAALFLIPILTPHTAYWVLGFVPTHLDIIYELHGIVLKPADLSLGVLLAATLLRLVTEWEYRRALHAASLQLLTLPVPRLCAALVLWMLLSVLWAEQQVLALYQALTTSLTLVMLLVLADWIHRHNSHKAMGVLTVSAVFQATLTILQSLYGGSVGLGWLGETSFAEGRGRGLTFNPNTEASYLVFSLFAAILWFALAENTRTRRRILPCIAIIFGGIVATLSGGALVAAVVGLGVLLWRSFFEHRQSGLLVVSICVSGMLALGMRASRGGPALEKRLLFGFPLTIDVIRASPVLGVGAGNLMQRADALVINGQYGIEEHFAYGQLQPAHNAYVTVWAELGFPGLLLFLLLCWEIGKELFNPKNTAALILGGCLLAIGVMMLFEFHFWLDVHWRLLLFWMVGLWIGCYLKPKENACTWLRKSFRKNDQQTDSRSQTGELQYITSAAFPISRYISKNLLQPVHCPFCPGSCQFVTSSCRRVLISILADEIRSGRNSVFSSQTLFIQSQIQEKQLEDQKLYRAYLANGFDELEFAERRKLLKEQVERLSDELTKVKSQIITEEQFEEQKRLILSIAEENRQKGLTVDAPFATKRQILKTVVDRIVLVLKKAGLGSKECFQEHTGYLANPETASTTETAVNQTQL